MTPAAPKNVHLSEDGEAVRILDQSALPGREAFLTLSKPDELREAICSLRVRGAPAIGIFAAFAVYVMALDFASGNFACFMAELRRSIEYLNSARPTAVNLRRMTARMLETARRCGDIESAIRALKKEALAIQTEDISMCRAIAENGLTLLRDGSGILTHCNAGPLATSLYGTALGPLILGHERGMDFHVWCGETRPLLQGARLTTYELQNAGIDCTLICDDMAAALMKARKTDAVLVGCDRLAANGDSANKIGTLGLAVLAKHFGVPFYVLLPSSTIDFNCASGAEIPIELRNDAEIRELFFKEPSAPEGVKCYNPAFDVTDAELITAVVTERGIARAPYGESLRRLFE